MSGLVKAKNLKVNKEDSSATVRSVITITEHLAYLFAVLMLIVFPLVAILVKGKQGAIVSGVSIFLTLPITVNILRSVQTLSFPRFIHACWQLLTSKVFQFVVLTLINVGIVLRIGLQTLIPLYILLNIFLFTSVVSVVITYYCSVNRSIRYALFISLALVPLAINLLLLANFVFSSTPTRQRFHFSRTYQIVHNEGRGISRERTTTITLDGQQYADYAGMRTFWDYEKMQNATFVTYTFEEGGLGIGVVTNFYFE